MHNFEINFITTGRLYPVQILYVPKPEVNYIEAALITTLQIHVDAPDPYGDILVFLTGAEEINELRNLLLEKCKLLPPNKGKLQILPLYSSLPPNLQQKVFQINKNKINKTMRRRVILATNIAETSITIPNIKYVVDTCKVKRKYYSSMKRIDIFKIVNISKSEAWQRSGRCGRINNGICFRLITENYFEKQLNENIEPEILRTNLRNIILQLKSIGIKNIKHFPFIDKPKNDLIDSSICDLILLNSLDPNNKLEITKLGKKQIIFPIDPMYSKILIKSINYKCTKEILIILSLLSIDNIFYYNKNNEKKFNSFKINLLFNQFDGKFGDIIMLLNIFKTFLEKMKDKNELTKEIKNWCCDHFINFRSIEKGYNIYRQLNELFVDNVNKKIYSIFDDENEEMDGKDKKYEIICNCMLEGLFLQSASYDMMLKCYKTAMDQIHVKIHPSSVLFHIKKELKPKNIMFSSIIKVKNTIWIKDITVFNNIKYYSKILQQVKSIQPKK